MMPAKQGMLTLTGSSSAEHADQHREHEPDMQSIRQQPGA